MPNVQNRISSVITILHNPNNLILDESVFQRYWLINEGINVISSKPLFGVGIDNSRFVLIPPHVAGFAPETGMYSHNNFIELALNAGIPGLILFYLPLIIIYFRINKTHPYWASLKSFISLYLLLGLTMVQYNLFITILLYSLIIFLFVYYKSEKSKIVKSVY